MASFPSETPRSSPGESSRSFPRSFRSTSLPATSSLSLRWRVMLLAMSMVAMVVVLMALAVYVVISRALYGDIDNQLHSRAQLLIESGSLAADPGKAIEGTAYSDVNAMLVNPGRSIYTANQEGQTLPIGQQEKDVISGQLLLSLRTADHQRVLAVHLNNGSSLLISKSLAPTGKVLKRLGTVLLIVGGIGVAIAAVAGGMVARAGLRPVARLTEAAERVARTDDLRPIPVVGSDELARLTEAFNLMLRGLAESRERQARLVTDAGHELRTPLTSLRTNVELLMASMAPGAPRLPEGEMAELRTDVIAQIEELSTLVGDLVDLTRDEAGGVVQEPVDMSDVVDRCLERVRRRRNDIEFDVDVIPWQVYGEEGGLSRAVLNLLDNAGRYGDPGTEIVIEGRNRFGEVRLAVLDHGPGLPPGREAEVFETFTRLEGSDRAVGGTGLGLAIVKAFAEAMGMMVEAGNRSGGGGAAFALIFPPALLLRDLPDEERS